MLGSQIKRCLSLASPCSDSQGWPSLNWNKGAARIPSGSALQPLPAGLWPRAALTLADEHRCHCALWFSWAKYRALTSLVVLWPPWFPPYEAALGHSGPGRPWLQGLGVLGGQKPSAGCRCPSEHVYFNGCQALPADMRYSAPAFSLRSCVHTSRF